MAEPFFQRKTCTAPENCPIFSKNFPYKQVLLVDDLTAGSHAKDFRVAHSYTLNNMHLHSLERWCEIVYKQGRLNDKYLRYSWLQNDTKDKIKKGDSVTS